ncbi:hypothetical protein ACFYW1_18875 [Streptomyces sp. NPDC002669]|uniref:hypothetical protein n=1 Tax=Streptomyces sp. NPDC002669 TaxID=3364658 RepID=UPI003694E311
MTTTADVTKPHKAEDVAEKAIDKTAAEVVTPALPACCRSFLLPRLQPHLFQSLLRGTYRAEEREITGGTIRWNPSPPAASG